MLVSGAKDKEIPEQTLIRLGAALLRFVLLPSELWGFRHDMSARQKDDCAAAMLHALMLAMPKPSKGDNVNDIDTRYPMTFSTQQGFTSTARQSKKRGNATKEKEETDGKA